MLPLDKLLSQDKGLGVQLVLPEGQDARIVEATEKALEQTELSLIVLNPSEKLLAYRDTLGKRASRLTLEAPKNLSEYESLYLALRAKKGATLEQAQQAVTDPIILAALLVRSGKAHGMVAGAATPTAKVVKTALQILGKAQEAKLVSSFFLMYPPQNHEIKAPLIFADCGLNIAPNSEELAEIAYQSAMSYEGIFNQQAKVAFLSFSTKGSASHDKVEHVENAYRHFKEQYPSITADGELQFDTAIIPSVANLKAPDSVLAGSANVLIFPDLNAGNIGYKIAQRLGHFAAIGPILQGLSLPANDLSRGCTSGDVLQMLALTALQSSAIK